MYILYIKLGGGEHFKSHLRANLHTDDIVISVHVLMNSSFLGTLWAAIQKKITVERLLETNPLGFTLRLRYIKLDQLFLLSFLLIPLC